MIEPTAEVPTSPEPASAPESQPAPELTATPEASASTTFTMVGPGDAAVCVDGVCVVPAATPAPES